MPNSGSEPQYLHHVMEPDTLRNCLVQYKDHQGKTWSHFKSLEAVLMYCDSCYEYYTNMMRVSWSENRKDVPTIVLCEKALLGLHPTALDVLTGVLAMNFVGARDDVIRSCGGVAGEVILQVESQKIPTWIMDGLSTAKNHRCIERDKIKIVVSDKICDPHRLSGKRALDDEWRTMSFKTQEMVEYFLKKYGVRGVDDWSALKYLTTPLPPDKATTIEHNTSTVDSSAADSDKDKKPFKISMEMLWNSCINIIWVIIYYLSFTLVDKRTQKTTRENDRKFTDADGRLTEEQRRHETSKKLNESLSERGINDTGRWRS